MRKRWVGEQTGREWGKDALRKSDRLRLRWPARRQKVRRFIKMKMIMRRYYSHLHLIAKVTK